MLKISPAGIWLNRRRRELYLNVYMSDFERDRQKRINIYNKLFFVYI